MLKNIKYLIGLSIIFSFGYSQITENIVEFNFGEHNALIILLNNVDKGLVEDEWKAVNSKFGKTDKKKGEYINKGVILEGVSNPIDWYMKLDKQKGDVELQLCVISNEEFMSSANQSKNFEIVSNFLNEFSYEVEKAKVLEKFKDAKNELSKLQKSLNSTNKDIEKNNDTIKKHNKKIDEANKNIEKNLNKQNETNTAIAEQNTIVENLLVNGNVPSKDDKGFEDFKKENDKLQKLQKKLERLADDYSGLIKTINKSTKKVEKASKDNKSNNKEIDKFKKKITKQGKLVESIRMQLESM